MSRVDLHLLKITNADVEAALAQEHRPGMRKRILAVKMVLEGKTTVHAGRVVKVHERTVRNWLRMVRRYGCTALAFDGRSGPRKKPIGLHQLHALREQIAAALTQPMNRHVRMRLLAVDLVLAGTPVLSVATEARVSPISLRYWIAQAWEKGVDGVIRVSEGRSARRRAPDSRLS